MRASLAARVEFALIWLSDAYQFRQGPSGYPQGSLLRGLFAAPHLGLVLSYQRHVFLEGGLAYDAAVSTLACNFRFQPTSGGSPVQGTCDASLANGLRPTLILGYGF